MSKNIRGVNIISNPTSIESKQRARRFKKYSANDTFKKNVTSIRSRIASGKNLFEIRSEMETMSDNEWSDAIYFLSANYYKTENIVLEWQLKQSTRYQLAAEAYNLAKLSNDYDAMMRAVIIMNKLDEQDIDMKSKLGIIKPMVVDSDEGGMGISNEDLLMTEEKFNGLLEKRIINKLSLQREAQLPVTIDVLSRSEDVRGTNNMGEITLVKNPTPGRIAENDNPEGISDGGEYLLHPVDIMARENKAD